MSRWYFTIGVSASEGALLARGRDFVVLETRLPILGRHDSY
jgi:hypothetical protein